MHFPLTARKTAAMSLVVVLSACTAPAPKAVPLNDPNEDANRIYHDFNKGLDRNVIRPVALTAKPVLDGPVGTGIKNVASNLSLPSDMLNNVLQGRLANATHNFWRFAINSTIGIAGIFDPATSMGLEDRSTDFGETMHIWGVGEGPFVEIPAWGPMTTRDGVGMVIDIAIDPIGLAFDGSEKAIALGASLAGRLTSRARYSDTVDSVLYDSEDSYSQSRLLYIQNRRFALGQEAAEDDFIDPYEDYGN